MTTIELEHSPLQSNLKNPYGYEPYGVHILDLTKRLVDSGHQPFLHPDEYPDMASTDKTFVTYMLDAGDAASDIARAIEGSVMHDDWQKSHEETQASSSVVENNSIFFLVIDTTNPEEPKPAASLSVADCLYGPSETRQTFVSSYGDEIVPSELGVDAIDAHEGLWDVMAVMAPREYRRTNAAYWAYYALYKASQIAGVKRWTASMNDKEFQRMQVAGIPFEIISGTGKIALSREGKADVNFGFHTINVDDIRPSMTKKIEELETLAQTSNPRWQEFANVARIALDGRYSPLPNSQQTAA